MISKLFSKIKNFFIISIPESDKEEFSNSLYWTNLIRAKYTAITFIILEVLILFISFFLKKGFLHRPIDKYYLAMYLIMLSMMAVYLFLFLRLEKVFLNKIFLVKLAGETFSGFLLLWCAAISLLDQFSSGQIIVYTVAILALAVTPIMDPRILLWIYMPCHTLFLAVLLFSWKTIGHTFSNCINSTSFIVVSLVIASMRYQNRLEDYNNKKVIQKKSEDLEKVNIRLAEANQQLEEANQKLEILTQTDCLTGIFNRFVFDKEIEAEWNRCKRRKEYLSLIMIDIDLFKAFNDNYGHQAGDACLKKVAETLANCITHPSHIVTRYGGEEFAIILPDTYKENAYVLAEAMRSRVEALQIPHGYSPISKYVTISLGVFTILPTDQSSIYDFIDFADKALYEAKSGCRNKIIVA